MPKCYNHGGGDFLFMSISVIHPSRSRPDQANNTIAKWFACSLLCNQKDFEYLLICDSDDRELSQYRNGRIEPIVNNNKSAIEAINYGASISRNDLLIVVSDDFDCPNHWDTLLLEALKDKSDFCVKTKDGYQPTLMTLPILDRAYYNRFGYIYNPIYEHNYADQEMTAMAIMLGSDISVDIEFTHNHWLKGKRVKDALDTRNWLTMQTGKPIYNQRVKENFGIANPVVPYNQIRWR